MKNIFATILIILFSITAYSQPQEYYKLAIGLNADMTVPMTGFQYGNGVNKTFGINKSKSIGGSFDYYFTPYVFAGVEYNMVGLKDGIDKNGKQFESNFSSLEFRVNTCLGLYWKESDNKFLNALRPLNASLGFGVVSGKNNVMDFGTDQYPRRLYAGDRGKTEFKSVFTVPLTVGYYFNLYNYFNEVKYKIGINYKFVYTNSDDIDGYNDDPARFSNLLPDMYSTFGVSFKYMLGPRRITFR